MDFPTLSRKPSFNFEETVEYKTLKSPAEDGYIITRPQWTKSKRGWHLTYNALTNSDYQTLKGFFESSTLGAAISFNWTNPTDNTSYVVRFKDDSLKATLKAFDIWSVEFDLEEV